MIDRPARPGILRANASFLLAGAGLILLNVLSPYLVRFMGSIGVQLSGVGLVCFWTVYIIFRAYFCRCAATPSEKAARGFGWVR